MDDTASILAQLHDIHLPSPPAEWPPSIALILLFFILIGGLGAVLFWFSYWRKKQRAKREALVLLDSYLKDYRSGYPASSTSARIGALLKRLALVYYPRQQVAALQGEDWINFLMRSSKGLDFGTVHDALIHLPYQAKESCALDELFRLVRLWILQRRKPCSN